MEIKSLRTNREGLVKLLEFLHGEENAMKDGEHATKTFPVYEIESLKTVDSITGLSEKDYIISLMNRSGSSTRAYDSRMLEVVKSINRERN